MRFGGRRTDDFGLISAIHNLVALATILRKLVALATNYFRDFRAVKNIVAIGGAFWRDSETDPGLL